ACRQRPAGTASRAPGRSTKPASRVELPQGATSVYPAEPCCRCPVFARAATLIGWIVAIRTRAGRRTSALGPTGEPHSPCGHDSLRRRRLRARVRGHMVGQRLCERIEESAVVRRRFERLYIIPTIASGQRCLACHCPVARRPNGRSSTVNPDPPTATTKS